jgi:hypothetical protein
MAPKFDLKDKELVPILKGFTSLGLTDAYEQLFIELRLPFDELGPFLVIYLSGVSV